MSSWTGRAVLEWCFCRRLGGMSEDKEAPVVDVKRRGAGSFRGADVSEGLITGVPNPAQHQMLDLELTDDSFLGVSILQG